MAGYTFFVAFGALSGNVATFLPYLLLLPISAVRLRQMLNLIKKTRIATEGDTSMEWLEPFMIERKYRRGNRLFVTGVTARPIADNQAQHLRGRFHRSRPKHPNGAPPPPAPSDHPSQSPT
jgi:hypothetical protein